MKEVAIFMSDFHLGQRDRTEEFVADEEFSELLGRLSLEHANNKVALVLLGDVIDLWTTVTEAEEVCAEQIEDIDLYFPAKTETEKKKALENELKKVREIANSHPLFFEALGRFLAHDPQKRRIVYVYGNHDHSLVDPDLQRELRHKILSKAVLEFAKKCTGMEKTELETCIEFSAFYEEKNLQVYAEHGNQLTYGGIFRYDNEIHKSTFDEFGSECPGYIHFKAVTSRVIRAAPKLNGLLMGVFNPANWPSLAVWLLLHGYFRALIYMQRFQIQYDNSENPDVMWARQNMPGPWETLFYMLKMRLRSVTKDEFGDVIPKLFERDTDPMYLPLCGEKLSPDTTKTLILGHSHGTRNIDIPGIEGLKYYNTGSWTLRQEKNREIIEQTWVVVSTELPVTITSIQRSGSEGILTVKDKFGNAREVKLRDPDALETLKRDDSIVAEIDAEGYALRIIRNDPTSPRIIDRQLVRRRVERAHVTNNPVTPDGARLNPVLRSMNLRVGDMILFRQNYGPYLWRLARSLSFGKLLAAIPGVITGLINRLGTSTYWNHIAMVYGSPSEPRESGHYNDPLIIESVPNIGVRIHTPEHYLEHPKEWNFSVLRVTEPLLKSWEARRLLRRITLNYLGAAYDQESVARGTIRYAALATNAKGRTALGGIIIGAGLGFLLISASVLVWTWPWLKDIWNSRHDAWQKSGVQFVTGVGNQLSEVVHNPTLWGVVEMAITIFALLIGPPLAVYVVLQLGRLLFKAWVVLTASVGALLGAGIVPIMADMTEGWDEKSVAERYWFALIWFSPLLLLIASTQLIVSITGESTSLTWDEYLRLKLILILSSGLFIVLFAKAMNTFSEFLIAWATARSKNIKELVNRLYITLKWPLPTPSRCNCYPLHKQFICSGLVQDALVETARELFRKSEQGMNFEKITTTGGNENHSLAEHPACEQEEVKELVGASLVRDALVETDRELSQKLDHNVSSKQIGVSLARRNEVSLVEQKVNPDDVQSGVIEETARRRLLKSGLEQVIVNPDWKSDAEWSQAEQSCILRDTLPRHFALAQRKFKWIYLHLDQVLTPDPTESCRAQAYTDPLKTRREAPPLAAIWAIKTGFTGLILTLGTAVNSSYLSQQFTGLPEPLLFGASTILGMVAIYKAREARRDLACNPNKRGRALTIGGFISGAFALLLGFGGLEGLVEPAFLPFMTKVELFLCATALLAGFLLLF